MTVVRIEHADGSDDVIDHIESEVTRVFGEMNEATIEVKRGEINEISPDERDAEVYIVRDDEDRFGGILRDQHRKGSQTELIVDSHELRARDSQPYGVEVEFEEVDDVDIIQDALDRVSSLTAGSMEVVGEITRTFNHSSPAKVIRSVQDITDAEVFYHPDRTVDYVEERGRDKTDQVLAPENQNISDFDADTNSSDGDVTHLRVLGEGEGAEQVRCNVVPSDDPEDYENDVRYDADDWEEGDQPVWRQVHNREIDDEDTLKEFGLRRMDELNKPFMEVELTSYDEVLLGDWFTLDYPEENIHKDELRAIEVTEIDDSDGLRWDVVFAKTKAVGEVGEERRDQDVQRYNSQAVQKSPPQREFDELDDAPEIPGYVVYINGSGSDAEGFYGYRSDEWTRID